jgi:hypothetical protein
VAKLMTAQGIARAMILGGLCLFAKCAMVASDPWPEGFQLTDLKNMQTAMEVHTPPTR